MEVGMKFTHAWDVYLSPAFLFRSKESSSGKWYAEKKLGYEKSSASKQQTVNRIMPQLKDLRATCLATPFKHAKWQSEEEYRAAMKKKMWGLDNGEEEGIDDDMYGNFM